MMKSKKLCMLLIVSMVLSLCGCGSQTQETSSATIELVDPVNAAASTERAAYRNLYDTEIYSATVYPQVTEYAFSKDVQVEGYAAYLGEAVEKGDALVYADVESLEKQIEEKEESLAEMQESFEEYKAELLESLVKPKSDADWYEDIVENLKKQEPPKMIASEDGSGEVENPEYTKWQAEYHTWEGKYRMKAHEVNVQEENLKQKEAFHNLDYEYNRKQLSKLKKQLQGCILTADMDGEVVAVAQADYGNLYAREDVSVVAVGSGDELLLKTEYINKDVISKAQEVYALIDGMKYEVEYQAISSEEYARLSAENPKVYSDFYIKGDTQNIKAGDFAVVVVTTQKKEQVLSVLKSTLSKDENGYYVYVLKDGENVYTPVKTGMTDGVYTEITSGLSEGDEVLVEKAKEYKSETVTVEPGSFSSSFSGWGFMYYPVTESIVNKVEHGTVYFEEFLVAQYQHVEKGDVIATIRVKSDEITIERNETALKRAQERLADLKAAGTDKNEDAILAKEEEIEELQELLREIKTDGATTQIVAPKSGMIVNLADLKAEDILSSNMTVATIADESTCYVVVENANQLLNYGNEVTVTYTNAEGLSKTVDGMVANVSPGGVSGGLQLEYSFILLPEEAIPDMAVSNTDRDGWWNRNRYEVKAKIRQMENVLVVPKKAVKDVAGVTYVNIVDEQGNITPYSFVAGGYDQSGYWVVEGLTEGMKLCLE